MSLPIGGYSVYKVDPGETLLYVKFTKFDFNNPMDAQRFVGRPGEIYYFELMPKWELFVLIDAEESEALKSIKKFKQIPPVTGNQKEN